MSMKTFIGTKEILAKPMTRQAYNDYRGWELPEDEDGSDDGMLVEYVDGGEPNHPDHKGYISWSPLDVFEKAYKVAETHVDRMRIERSELQVKCDALTAFINGAAFEILCHDEQVRLKEQIAHMAKYLEVLSQRIRAA